MRNSQMRKLPLLFLLCTAAFGVSTAQAQPANDKQPAAVTLEGATIVGDRELPIGLYISPWRSANPEAEFTRPARQLDVRPALLDPEVFARQIEYYEALDAATRQR